MIKTLFKEEAYIMKRVKILTILCFVFAYVLTSNVWALKVEERRSISTGSGTPAAKKEEVTKAIKNLRVPFIENRGQYDGKVFYTAKTFGGTVFVTRDGGLVYDLPKMEKDVDERHSRDNATEVSRTVAPRNEYAGSHGRTKDSWWCGN